MSSPRPSQQRMRTCAPVACAGCRRLKMRCVGAENPPCVRCHKARRACVVQAGSQTFLPSPMSLGREAHQQSFSDSASDSIAHLTQAHHQIGPPEGERPRGHQSSSAGSMQPPSLQPSQPALIPQKFTDALPTTELRRQSFGGDSEPLPSVYSISPVDMIESQQTGEKTPSHTKESTDSRPVSNSLRSNSYISDWGERILNPRNLNQLRGLIQFFNSRLLHNLPFLLGATTQDFDELISNQRPLIYCAAFVTMRFVPGYAALRRQMVPEILNIIDLKHCPATELRGQGWTILQSCAILYAYSSGRPSDDTRWRGELSSWSLKSTVEMFASRLALHRSGEEFRNILTPNSEVSVDPIETRRYVLWLWIYTMSHHASLLMRVPPTIGVDTNIRSASTLLEGMSDSRIRRVLAEVELCLLWNESAKYDPAANEWWCSPPVVTDVNEALTTLERLERTLELWRTKWLPGGMEVGSIDDQGGPTDFHYRFTRFCISTYITRLLYQKRPLADKDSSDSTADIFPLPVIKVLLRSIDRAVDCCTIFPTLSPLQRDQARYISDGGFAMLALPCFYIIRASEMLRNFDVSFDVPLQKVAEVAHMMLELAVDSSHSPKVYGTSVLAKLSASNLSRGQNSTPDTSDRALQQAEHVTENFNSHLRYEPAIYGGGEDVGLAHQADADQLPHDPDWDFPLAPEYMAEFSNMFSFHTDLDATADISSTFDGEWLW